MNGNGELVRLLLGVSFAALEHTLAAKEVDRHPLDGADEDERVSGLRVGQVSVRHHVGIDGSSSSKSSR
jgi:hypothetical protein